MRILLVGSSMEKNRTNNNDSMKECIPESVRTTLDQGVNALFTPSYYWLLPTCKGTAYRCSTEATVSTYRITS